MCAARLTSMAQLRETDTTQPARRRRHKTPGQTCLNCTSEIETRYCPHCGQENAGADLTLGAVVREFFAEVFYYDSKLWRTLRMLLFHPGRLSTEWSAGRRTAFLSPVRLYLSITFLFFIAAAWNTGRAVIVNRTLSPQEQADVVHKLQTAHLTLAQVNLARKELQPYSMTPEARKQLDDVLAKASTQAAARAPSGSANAPVDLGLLGSTHLTGWFGRQIMKVEEVATNDPSTFQRRFVDQFPKVLFVVLPLFAVVLTALYWRQRRYFVEHLVFILHLHSFAFLVLLPIELIPGRFLPDPVVPLVVGLWLPIYAFVAMLRFYRQPWWLTILKGLVLNAAYLILLGVGALLALVITVTTYSDPTPQASAARVLAVPPPVRPGPKNGSKPPPAATANP
ncbi:MAG: DUF3667 domain-containing protein [Fimbriimonadaceae bacterium]